MHFYFIAIVKEKRSAIKKAAINLKNSFFYFLFTIWKFHFEIKNEKPPLVLEFADEVNFQKLKNDDHLLVCYNNDSRNWKEVEGRVAHAPNSF